MLQLILKLFNSWCINTKRVNLLLDLVSVNYQADEINVSVIINDDCYTWHSINLQLPYISAKRNLVFFSNPVCRSVDLLQYWTMYSVYFVHLYHVTWRITVNIVRTENRKLTMQSKVTDSIKLTNIRLEWSLSKL